MKFFLAKRILLQLFFLSIATCLLWQFRFVRASPNLVAVDVCQDLRHWLGNPNDATICSASEKGLTLTKQKGGRSVSLNLTLPRIDDVRFLCVSMDAAWENAKAHDLMKWAMPRVVVFGTDAKGAFSGPVDHGVLGARGTRDWHRVQGVVDLPPEMQQVRLSVDVYGDEGTLHINRMQVEAVKQRAWFVYGTIFLLGLWCWWLAAVISPWVAPRLRMGRALAIAAGVLLGSWYFVFPQDRTLYKPFLPEFFMGVEVPKEIVTPPIPAVVVAASVAEVAPAPAPTVEPRRPRLRTLVVPPTAQQPVQPSLQRPKVAAVVPPVVEPPPPVRTPVEARHSTRFLQRLREIDRKWNFQQYNLSHFTAFLGIGLFVFLLGGSGRIWPIPVTIAILGEIIPNALFDSWDAGDWADVAANLLGLAVAYGCLRGLRAWRSARVPPQSESEDLNHPPVVNDVS